jgi:YVTN family beta-propeller protein
VAIYDTANLNELSTVKVGNTAWFIAVDEANNRAYVTKREENGVSVIDTKSDKIVGSMTVGNAPVGIAVDSESKRAYVANHGDVSVSVIDTEKNEVIHTIKLSPATDSTYSGSPWGIAIN